MKVLIGVECVYCLLNNQSMRGFVGFYLVYHHNSLDRVDSKMESREGERQGEYFQEETYTPT